MNLRDVPDDVCEALTQGAQASRQSLNAFVVQVLAECCASDSVRQPTGQSQLKLTSPEGWRKSPIPHNQTGSTKPGSQPGVSESPHTGHGWVTNVSPASLSAAMAREIDPSPGITTARKCETPSSLGVIS
jgi:hypothetical protein